MAAKTTQPPVLVFSGPSGAGKSTLLNLLIHKYPNKFGFSVSHTTRKIRQGEENGKDYFFTDKETFQKDISEGKFLEYAEFAGNIYGTSRYAVQSVLDLKKICILDVDLEGVKSIHDVQPPLESVFILIVPPSIDVLERRLRDRGTETEASIAKRLKRAKNDMILFQSPEGRKLFDVVVRNEILETSFEDLEKRILPFIEILEK